MDSRPLLLVSQFTELSRRDTWPEQSELSTANHRPKSRNLLGSSDYIMAEHEALGIIAALPPSHRYRS